MPDGPWEIFPDVAPEPPVRAQGSGRRRYDDRTVLAAIIFVAASGRTWRQLPPVYGASRQTEAPGSGCRTVPMATRSTV
ncbi:transposase [Streptomyces luteireticuli]|uniref:transposase n=1 Tax=Streptomyces luteireticuli TaxID=173858 RepID=UPI003CD0BE82